ncbi:Penicillin-binding protein 1B [Vibrio aerogenes CECT 7868]|uniref:Penicillin-binding protein 1B n=1 Tax=Vibrio aerogenes CECT 7868 TaxID=1216006 RepID=A0A1M5YB74_9VIBR|nr:penicillin-binding protein 1B [Vibrio aerogenes]SHI09330.1 Penicillin-binding protein 1B [Vibrio aerogenes CECT 7868]
MTKKKTTSTDKKKSPASSGKPKGNKQSGWMKKFWKFGWKFGLTVATVVIFYGFYLNSVISKRFESQPYDLPTIVYARILNLSPGDQVSLQDIRHELDVLNYRKVARPRFAGEYSASSSKIEVIRRPFEFTDGAEPERHVMLFFNGDQLSRIYSMDMKKDLGFLRIEPKMLGMLEKNTPEQRLFLRREEFPEVMVDALLATEDRHFYQHDGIAPFAILRALVANVKAGRTVQGGSTLTQQLVKNIFLTNKRTLWRKLQEAYMALIIDYRFSKDRILEAYLNEVYLGQNGAEEVHGFGLASRLYFGQPLQELRIDQLALLVGMVKGASYYNPVRFPKRARTRRDLVLKLMMQQDILTAKQYAQAVVRPLDLQKYPHIARRQPAYFQQLSIELKHKIGDLYQADKGLKVFTTLDPVSQQELENAVRISLARLGNKKLESAAIAVDRHSGEIRAMVGGKRAGYDGFNRVLNASRQIGSLVKPAVYLTALSDPQEYNLTTALKDEPLSLKSAKGDIWTPQNFDRKFRGEVPLYLALAKSINIPTVRLGMKLGIQSVSRTLVHLGIDENEIRPLPSMFLGAFSLSPIQVAQMYQTLTNSGKKSPLSALRSVIDLDGNVLYQSIPKSKQAVSQQAAWLTTYAMKKGVMEGTGRYLNSRFSWAALAGKTGTSNDLRDSWFVGIDGREVTTVWVGRDDNKPTGLTGASGALRVYAAYLERRGPEKLTLPWPKGITMIGFDKQRDGTLKLACEEPLKFPVWDVGNRIKEQCKRDKPLHWLRKIFEW